MTLTASDINALVSGMEVWRHSLTKQVEQLGPDKPEAHGAAMRRIGRLEELEELLIRQPSGLTDPPLELDADHASLVQEALGELTGYQRGELTGGLRELKLAFDRR